LIVFDVVENGFAVFNNIKQATEARCRMGLLQGRCAVVTGSTKGIGRAIALEFAHQGAQVAINHRPARTPQDAEALAETARQLTDLCGQAPLVVEADLTVEADAVRLAESAWAHFGRVDIWVNNVGKHNVTPALPQSLENWEEQFQVNCTSAFLGCREAARRMKDTGGGSIINITTKMASAGSAENAAYCASKAAVNMMTQCLAAEWAQYGIRLNALAPGVTLTGPTYQVVAGKPALEAALHFRTPLGRFARPQEIGQVAAFLASDLASYVSGAIIACDGGWNAHADFAGIPPDKLRDWEQAFPPVLP
jgi:NAD(P)-dependent dehydrogenase (short-subunit alcohol dehydrogenase family)